MIGMVRPLVKRTANHWNWLYLVNLYGVGATTSSALFGSFLGAIGSLIVPSIWFAQLVVIVAIFGLLITLSDFQIAGLRTPTTTRQTCSTWWALLGQRQAMVLWGLDLGLGFTTIRVASLYWVVLLVIIILSSPLLGAIILCSYGLGLTLNLVVGLLLLDRLSQCDGVPIQVLRLWQPLKQVLALILLFWSLWMIFLALGLMHVLL